VPPAVRFRTKPEIALDQLRWAVAAGLPGRIVLMDAAYRAMRGGVRELDYAAAVPRDLLAAPVGSGVPAELRRGRRGEARAGAARVDVLARGPGDWQAVEWREGGAGMLGGRFAARRVRTAPSDVPGWLGPEEWLLIEDADEPGGRSHWLISLPADTPLADLCQGPLAGRAGLSRPQAGGRARPLRGTLLARPEPPYHPVPGGLRLPRSRAKPFPPRHPGPQLPANQPPGPP
jgi:hypothetical protein